MSKPALSIRHIPALDGVRGLAILLVMLFHMAVIRPVTSLDRAWALLVHQGDVGVIVFFVLSGYLITGILYDSRETAHYFRNFYARRLLRIFPLYYAMVFVAFIVLPHVSRALAEKMKPAQPDQIWYWLHLSNFAIARAGKFDNGIIGVAWSLAIEEQFYLVWPVVVLLLSRRWLMRLAIGLTILPAALRYLCDRHGMSPVALYTLTFCRTDGLAIGAFVALLVRGEDRPSLAAAYRTIAVAAVATIVSFRCSHNGVHFAAVVTNQSAVSVLAAAVIYVIVVTPESTLMMRCFDAVWLRSLGRLSYAVYLFHYPIMGAIRDKLFPNESARLILGSVLPMQFLFYFVAIGMTYFLALASWYGYESHFLKLKRFFPTSTAPSPVPSAHGEAGATSFSLR